MLADALPDSVNLSDFDFTELEDAKIRVVGNCPDCGISVHENRGCWCSGRRTTYHSEPHKVWAPFDHGANTNPDPRAEFKFSTSPDYDRYREMLEEAFAAKPCLQDFVRDFDWDNDSTENFRSMMDELLEQPQIQTFLKNLSDARDPVRNFCNKEPTITPSSAAQYKVEADSTGKIKHPPTDLGYLCKSWFKKAADHFRKFIKVLHRDSVYKQIRIFTQDPCAYSVLTDGFKISDTITFEIVGRYEEANVYVFGASDFQASIASSVKNVFGLCWNAPVHNCSYPFDVDLISHGWVNIRVPFGVEGTKGEAPLNYFHDTPMITYKGMHYLIPRGKFSYISSGTFDTPWVDRQWDPITKIPRKVFKTSKFSNCVGVAMSYYAVKQSAVTVPVSNLVQTSTAEGVEHPLLNHLIRQPIHFYDLADPNCLAEEFVIRKHTTDALCHWSLYAGKTFCDLIIRSPCKSVRRHLVGDFGRAEAFHGFGILDFDGNLINPVCYQNPRSPGSSLITLLDARLFTLFNNLGGWAIRNNVSYADVMQQREILGRTDFWIISALRPSSFFVNDSHWYPPICELDFFTPMACKNFNCPPVGSSAFELWASCVNLRQLCNYDLRWQSSDNLGRRRFNPD